MFVLGLTGSIGMGKSTAARRFAQRGVPVHDADAAVHELYAGDAVGPISEAFPGVVENGRVDRTRLGAAVIGDPKALARLEAIVHPLVRIVEHRFLDACAAGTAPLAILEVPLLLETGGAARVDAVAVVSAPAGVQRSRVLARPGMDEARLKAILARQISDADKRRRAHFILDTSRDMAFAARQVDGVIRALAGRPGRAYSVLRAPQGG